MKQKILFVSNLYPSSIEPTRSVFNHELMKAMAEDCDIKVIAPYFWFPGRKILPATEQIDGIDIVHPRIVYIPRLLIHLHWILYWLSVKSCFRKMINRFQPDQVILGFLYPDVVAMGAMCREMGIDYSVRVNGSDFYLRSKQRRFRSMVMDELMQAPRVFCPGEALKSAMVAQGVNADKIVAFDNGVDASVFKYRDRGDDRELKDFFTADPHRSSQIKDKKIVLFVGNLVSVKNPSMLIEAFGALVTRNMKHETGEESRFQLIMIGSGAEGKSLEKQAERLGISDRVLFLGARPHFEVALWMNAADCLCLSSKSEGMPNVILESLSSGLPVVATDAGECRRLLESEPNSRVVPITDTDKMTEALNDILSKDIDRQAMAARCCGKYSWIKTTGIILKTINH